jgi:ketosteroid isomerase-like protein
MRFTALMAFIALMFSAVNVQVSQAQARPVTPQSVIEESERAWADALLKQDVARVSGLLDPRFQLAMVGNFNSATVEAYLQLSKERAYKAMAPTIVNVAVNGDVAVAIVDMKVGWPEGFPPLHSYWRFTDTWLQDGNTWRAVSRVAQPIPN